MSKQTMYPAFHYRDAKAALAWMKETLGAEELTVVPDGEERIAHAEVRIAGGILMFGSEDSGREIHRRPPGTGSVYVAVDDVDALHDRVVAAGGEVFMGLTDADYGSRDFGLRDPEGNLWNFGTYRP